MKDERESIREITKKKDNLRSTYFPIPDLSTTFQMTPRRHIRSFFNIRLNNVCALYELKLALPLSVTFFMILKERETGLYEAELSFKNVVRGFPLRKEFDHKYLLLAMAILVPICGLSFSSIL